MLLAQERSLSLTVVWNLIRQWGKKLSDRGEDMTPYIQALIAMTSDKLQQRMQKDPTSASDSLLFYGQSA